MKASISNSIQRSAVYLKRGELDFALASIDGLSEHLESITIRGSEAEGSEEFTASQLNHIETALRNASLAILTQRLENARDSLSEALAILSGEVITGTPAWP